MTIEVAYRLVTKQQPHLVYVSGKTSTGKSTFAKRLAEEFNYAIIELDQIVLKAVEQRFGEASEKSAFIEVYRNRDEREWIDAFVNM